MPTEIWTAEDLNDVRDGLAGEYIQMADIDLSGYAKWAPIGDFTGTYNGNSFTISNLTIPLTSGDEGWKVGLFSQCRDNATLENITLDTVDIDTMESSDGEDVGALCGVIDHYTQVINCKVLNFSVKGMAYVGGLIGVSYRNTQIVGCSVENGTVIASVLFGGGLLGRARENTGTTSLIQGCSARNGNVNTSEVYGTHVGGLIGMVDGKVGGPTSITVEESMSSFDVIGAENVGGLLGWHGAILRNCYARGNATGLLLPFLSGGKVGGLVGVAYDVGSTTNCYSTGVVAGETMLGGLIGERQAGAAITESYYDTETSGQSDTGQGEPRLTLEMAYPYTDKHTEGTFVNWDFENKHITDLTEYDFVFGEPWKHDPTFTLNDGYPLFEPTPVPTLTKIGDCITPAPPIFSVSLNYGNFNSMVIEREEAKITQYRFINPETDLTLRTKWRYLTPKLEHNVECGFEVRGILIRYKVRGQKPRVRPED